jgi:flavin-dependent dehydrogenase
VGGGPAGLASGLAAARRGAAVLILERRSAPPDKACGEGLLPPAIAALAALGVLGRIPAGERAPFRAVRYLQEHGSCVEARLPAAGLGVRRTALVGALAEAARGAGAVFVGSRRARGFRRRSDAILVDTDEGPIAARLLVAADGLASPLRRAAGLDAPARGPRRFGMRRHYRIPPWADAVELYFGDGAEAYVTPAGPERVGVAFLWEDGCAPADYPGLLARFPRLAARLAGAPPETRVLGAGPLSRAARRRVAERFLLIGDAAGYVDAITGEGLSLALESALLFGEALPEMLAAGGRREALEPWARACARRYRRYALVTRSVLALARRPSLRRAVLAGLARSPALFERIVAWALERPPARPGELSVAPA